MSFDEQLINWILNINASEKPDANIIAYNFGLLETSDGFSIYLIGSKVFDAEDDDWACKEDFTPEQRYLNFNSQEFKQLTWNDFLERATDTLRTFINSNLFPETFLSAAKAITVGFDEGELRRLV